ncbi:MAG: BON domain-containing protein, partial [Vicinamibacterales bacterium]
SDAQKIGGSAAGGAVLGAILGGGDGAAKGAAIGGAAGTGVVLGTRGKEVRVPAGTNLAVTLQRAITIRVRQ